MTATPPVIDAHQHVWDLSRADYPWLTEELEPINRTIEFKEALPELTTAGVTGTVLVQAADNADDTAAMFRVADAHPEVVGVVGWLPLDDVGTAERMLAELRRDPRFVGVRTLLHARPDFAWVLRPDVREGLVLLEEAGIPFDYVTGDPAALALLPALSERHPRLDIVIDHLGKPPIGGSASDRSTWRDLLAAAAANPRISAKVSGLYSSIGDLANWTVAGVRPFLDDALELFGADRLMFGGDWPISILAGGYARTWAAITELTRDLSVSERAALLGGTAASFYSLPL